MPSNGETPRTAELGYFLPQCNLGRPHDFKPSIHGNKIKRGQQYSSAPPVFHPRHQPRLKRDGFPLPISFKTRGVPRVSGWEGSGPAPGPPQLAAGLGGPSMWKGGRRRLGILTSVYLLLNVLLEQRQIWAGGLRQNKRQREFSPRDSARRPLPPPTLITSSFWHPSPHLAPSSHSHSEGRETEGGRLPLPTNPTSPSYLTVTEKRERAA